MRWSILVPGVFDRPDPACLASLRAQVQGYADIEVLYMVDNRRRSIGAKRQALLDVARGDYVSFVDDDDEVAEIYVEAISFRLDGSCPATVTFDQTVRFASGVPDCHLICKAGNPNEQLAPGQRIRRGVWHFHVWRAEIARRSTFPDIDWGEDWQWAEPLQDLARPSVHIGGGALYLYHERRG